MGLFLGHNPRFQAVENVAISSLWGKYSAFMLFFTAGGRGEGGSLSRGFGASLLNTYSIGFRHPITLGVETIFECKKGEGGKRDLGRCYLRLDGSLFHMFTPHSRAHTRKVWALSPSISPYSGNFPE